MVSRRIATHDFSDRPIRFYKTVALSFLAITVVLFLVIMFLSSKRAVITITTRPEPVDATATVSVSADKSGSGIAGVLAVAEVSLKKEAHPTGTTEAPGFATGTLVIYNETNAPQTLVATTRLLTSDNILFRLKDRVIVPAGGEITAAVQADAAGAAGNVGLSTFTIPGLNEAKQKVIYAKSIHAMTGGVVSVGTVGESDIRDAQKSLLADFEAMGKKQLQEKYPNDSGVFRVDTYNITTSADPGEEVSSFTAEGTAIVIGVLYNTEDLKQRANDALAQKASSDAIMIEPGSEDPAVALGEYDLKKGRAYLDVTYTGLARLNPESKAIGKLMFYGKSKDEVRRYLLSLDHVYSVDVRLRPAWSQTVPHVADHVSVIIKTVE